MSSLTKYCNNSSFGYEEFTDDKTVLDAVDDAAHVNWGGNWRMPTKDELEELVANCTWTWSTINGVSGYRVISNVKGFEGRFIFLPAAGYRYDWSLDSKDSYGYYWSSSLYTSYPSGAWCFAFDSDDASTSNGSRQYGRVVRPVCPKE